MRQNVISKAKAVVDARVCMLDMELIDPPQRNTRYEEEDSKISSKDLNASVRDNGVLQAILVRPRKQGRVIRYEVVAGERRYYAAKAAKLKQIPAQIRELDDAQALNAQLIENIQREDVHPLAEAKGLLRLKEEAGLEIPQIAQRIGKDARYVARRLQLTNLIEEARADFKKDLITLAHALEICRYSPDIQKQTLDACYEYKVLWDKEQQTHIHVPDKELPARNVKYLQSWLEHNVHLNLQSAPFKLDDARLRPDGLTCIDCPERTGHNQMLFNDISNTDTCLNPPCFRSKTQTLVQLQRAELETKTSKPAILLSPFYSSRLVTEGALVQGTYQVLPKKNDRCQHAEQAVFVEGDETGQVKWICKEKSCKDHLGRSRNNGSDARQPEPHSSETRSERRQELFDLKVDEAVRKRVMAEAVKNYAWPLVRTEWNEIAKEYFRQIPRDHQRTILEVFGWSEDKTGKLLYDSTVILEEITNLSDDRLAQFFMLCSFAHFGANPAMTKTVDQTNVAELAKTRNVNHQLIDAQVRVELAPKKYKAAHQSYLEAVTNGKKARKPLVYEQAQPPASDVTEPKQTPATVHGRKRAA